MDRPKPNWATEPTLIAAPKRRRSRSFEIEALSEYLRTHQIVRIVGTGRASVDAEPEAGEEL